MVEIKWKLPKNEIELEDSDYALYLTLKELILSIKDLTKAMRNFNG